MKRQISAEEAAEYYESHSTHRLPGKEVPVSVDRNLRTLISIRLSWRLIKLIKAIGKSRGVAYQSLIQQWLWEKIESEFTKERNLARSIESKKYIQEHIESLLQLTHTHP
ncbi:MAG: hypothetical protein HY610_01940 [Elusimicrobia bacterium]|nr:hypothetical protein [Elusimicrobiota bacterium]